jgi:hypothetical protein
MGERYARVSAGNHECPSPGCSIGTGNTAAAGPALADNPTAHRALNINSVVELILAVVAVGDAPVPEPESRASIRKPTALQELLVCSHDGVSLPLDSCSVQVGARDDTCAQLGCADVSEESLVEWRRVLFVEFAQLIQNRLDFGPRCRVCIQLLVDVLLAGCSGNIEQPSADSVDCRHGQLQATPAPPARRGTGGDGHGRFSTANRACPSPLHARSPPRSSRLPYCEVFYHDGQIIDCQLRWNEGCRTRSQEDLVPGPSTFTYRWEQLSNPILVKHPRGIPECMDAKGIAPRLGPYIINRRLGIGSRPNNKRGCE